jgi:chaperonin cofactor prefoldin
MSLALSGGKKVFNDALLDIVRFAPELKNLVKDTNIYVTDDVNAAFRHLNHADAPAGIDLDYGFSGPGVIVLGPRSFHPHGAGIPGEGLVKDGDATYAPYGRAPTIAALVRLLRSAEWQKGEGAKFERRNDDLDPMREQINTFRQEASASEKSQQSLQRVLDGLGAEKRDTPLARNLGFLLAEEKNRAEIMQALNTELEKQLNALEGRKDL